MLNIPWSGLVWFLVIVGLAVGALLVSEPLGDWLREQRRRRAEVAAIAARALGQENVSHPAGEGALRAKAAVEALRASAESLARAATASDLAASGLDAPLPPAAVETLKRGNQLLAHSRKRSANPTPKSPPKKKPAKRKKRK